MQFHVNPYEYLYPSVLVSSLKHSVLWQYTLATNDCSYKVGGSTLSSLIFPYYLVNFLYIALTNYMNIDIYWRRGYKCVQ